MTATHVVQDLEFEIDFESEDQALDLQDRVGAFARGPALRILCEAFNEAGLGTDRMRLDRLEVDLGVVEADELEQQWADRLREQLRHALAELAATEHRVANGAAAAAKRTSPAEAELDTLLGYLRQGVMPWHASGFADPAALAQRVLQRDRQALVARLRAWPDAQAAARRMAGQFPPAWCEELTHALLGDVAGATSEPGQPSAGSSGVEQRLLHALRVSARAGALVSGASISRADGRPAEPRALRAVRRRWRALLVDDAPEMADGDLDELMQLWQRMLEEDPDGLREDLQALGSRARVRRRMARLWPESLLRQLPRLWLGAEGAGNALAALQDGPAQAGVTARRQRWEALLRLLWNVPAEARIDAKSLERAMRGRAASPPMATLRVAPGRVHASHPLALPPRAVPSEPSTRAGWGGLLAGEGDATARRLALRLAVSSKMGRRRLLPSITQSRLAQALAMWWTESDARALAELAFAPLPAAWQRGDEAVPHSETLIQLALQALHDTADGEWTGSALASRWWHGLAVHLSRSPSELLNDLAAAAAAGGDTAQARAWLRWLPWPSQGSKQEVPSLLSAALQRGDRAAVQAGWSALLAGGEPVARVQLRAACSEASGRAALVEMLTAAHWMQLLELFLGPAAARDVSRAEAAMRLALGEPASAELEGRVRGWILPVLLWHPAATVADVTSQLLSRAARYAGLSRPELLRGLPGRGEGLFAAESEGLDAAAVPLEATHPKPSAAGQDPPRQRQAEAEAAAAVVAALRDGGTRPDLAGGWAASLKALVDGDAAVARESIERELESAHAARTLAHALTPDELLRTVAWLRPADAAELQASWPGLVRLATAHGARSWPQVARAVLRELFEEDRLLRPGTLLRRAERELQGLPDASAAPWVPEPTFADPLFVANAGVVLLAPYLPRLFVMLGLADDKAFVDTEAAEQAVAVTHYAVTGLEHAPETVLPLDKLLCGLPLHAPVLRERLLAAREREAVEGMLDAVIGHWKALGRTSVAGLRQTFLQREGRLEHRQDAWHLQVPSQTFDMLIDRLPWGFATIRYPWMPEVLHVQWR